jgi:5'-3' exonuclease
LPSYKGNRKPKPDHYHEILDAVTEFANPIFLRTYEADDLIALFSVYLSKLGHTSTIHTVDGDLMQLITPSCTWSSLAHWAPMVRSIDNWQEWFAKRKIAKKYWVAANTPHHAMSLYKYGLGDSSDNYPKHSDPLIWDLLVSPIFDEKLDMPGLLEIHSRHVNLNTGMQAKELLLRSGCSLPYHVEEIGW